MTNSKDGQGHRDKYLDTSRKILSQEMLMCNMKDIIFIKNNETQERSYLKEYSYDISKLLHLLFKSLSKVEVFNNGSNYKVKVTG